MAAPCVSLNEYVPALTVVSPVVPLAPLAVPLATMVGPAAILRSTLPAVPTHAFFSSTLPQVSTLPSAKSFRSALSEAEVRVSARKFVKQGIASTLP